MKEVLARRIAAVFGGILLGGGVSAYLETTGGRVPEGVLFAGLGVGLMAAALVRE